jgi:hypothetical protein
MTVAVANPIVSYVAAGVGPYPIPFTFSSASDVKVIARSSTGVDTTPAFTIGTNGVTLSVPPNTGTIIVYRETPADQTLALSDLSAFPASAVEASLDRVVLQQQELRRDLNRGLRFPLGFSMNQLPSDMRGQVISFDANNQPIGIPAVVLPDIPQNTVLGRVAAGSGPPTELNSAQIQSILNLTTDQVSEGAINVYWTAARFDARVATTPIGNLSGTLANAKLSSMAANTVKVNATASSGPVTDLALGGDQLLGRGGGDVQAIGLGAGLQITGGVLDTTASALAIGWSRVATGVGGQQDIAIPNYTGAVEQVIVTENGVERAFTTYSIFNPTTLRLQNTIVGSRIQARLPSGAQGASGAGLTDGDKGDIVVSGGGTAWAIKANSVTDSDLAAVGANTIKANPTAGTTNPSNLTIAASRIVGRGPTGNLTALTVGAGLTLTDTSLSVTPGAAPRNDTSSVAGNASTHWTGTFYGNAATGQADRMNRLFVGPATANTGNIPATASDWTATYTGLNDGLSNATLGATSAIGSLAIAGFSRSSDYRTWAGGAAGGATGLYGMAINDDALSSGAIAATFFGEAGVTANCAGITEVLELTAFSGRSSIATVLPHTGITNNTIFVANFSTGFRAGYNGNMSCVAVLGASVGLNTSKFEVGLVFPSVAATGGLNTANGSGGGGIAEAFGRGQSQRWYGPSGQNDAEIYGDDRGLVSTAIVNDPGGNVRNSPIVAVGAHTLTRANVGMTLGATGTITIPTGMQAGDEWHVICETGPSITIVPASGVTLRWLPSGSLGTRTLGPWAYATIRMRTSTDAYLLNDAGVT